MRKVNKRDDDIYEIIAANIKEYRKQANMTQAELAEKSNYSHEFIRRIEATKGKKYFFFFSLVKIARAMRVRVEILLKGISDEEK